MDEEMKELFRELEEQGWEPMLCDTPVPYFDNKVMCGVPNGIGDIVAEEMLIPKRWASIDGLFITTVQGDSMIDANIVEGDRIFVEETNAYNDGDILLVSIDGEYTLKSYCKDEDGNPWLIPQNAAYRAFQLHEHENVRVRGVVRMVIKESPQVNFRSCIKKIKAAKQLLPTSLSRQQLHQFAVPRLHLVSSPFARRARSQSIYSLLYSSLYNLSHPYRSQQ